jgi:hypothetical protein
MDIFNLTKEEMLAKRGSPYFGYTMNYPDGHSTIDIRSDLPPRVYASVLMHEKQHVADRAFMDGSVWHWELRAYAAQFSADWVGTLQTIWLSLTSLDRLKLYWQRLTSGF